MPNATTCGASNATETNDNNITEVCIMMLTNQVLSLMFLFPLCTKVLWLMDRYSRCLNKIGSKDTSGWRERYLKDVSFEAQLPPNAPREHLARILT